MISAWISDLVTRGEFSVTLAVLTYRALRAELFMLDRGGSLGQMEDSGCDGEAFLGALA